MASVARIKFEIAFEGSSQCWKNADVCAIDLVGPKSEVSARSVGTGDSSLKAGRLKWCIPNKDSIRPLFEREKFVEQVGLTPEIARTIQLTARVFESYDNLSRLVKGLDGAIKPERWARRHDVSIVIENHAELDDGGSYLIKVRNVGERRLRATFIKLDEQTSKKSTSEETKAQVASTEPMRTSSPT